LARKLSFWFVLFGTTPLVLVAQPAIRPTSVGEKAALTQKRSNVPAAVTESTAEKFARRAARLWSLQPVQRPAVPAEGSTGNPIDAFVREVHKAKGLHPVGRADKSTLLRRVYLDLVGLPPSPAEQETFLQDKSPDAFEKVVDKLLADEQHGVRWARHWLDVLRYADLDGLDGSVMPAASGIYLWREWVISALNQDVPYDEFVRAQILGNRSRQQIVVRPGGQRAKAEASMADQFALGFLARAALNRADKEQDISLAAVETISTAFMGMTVGCAKCHDHMYDPIRQEDFYSMKALFDPLVLRKVVLASPAEVFANGRQVEQYNTKKVPLDAAIERLVAPYREKLYDERVSMLTPDVQAVIRKAENDRTDEEQKIADDYYPVLRIDPSKIRAVMTAVEKERYNGLLKQLGDLERPADLPSYWTVEEDSVRLKEKSFVLTSGDPKRPEKERSVEPGFPFQPQGIQFRNGRREAFVEWLTAPNNPLFARVAVNRIWQWHFGEGLHRVSSDFGVLGAKPSNQKLLDYLASEFVAHDFSMKWLHKLILTSETYQMASKPDPEQLASNQKIDQRNTYLWRFRLQRLDAEPIWDSLLYSSGDLDLSVGGKSFQLKTHDKKQSLFVPRGDTFDTRPNRRAIYMARGYIPSTDVMSNFLQSFDVDDGRTPCPIRGQTVTAPQALFTMNDELIERQSAKVAEKLLKQADGDIPQAVSLAYRTVIGRAPTGVEVDRAQAYVGNDPRRMKGLAWLLFNLDEFMYVR
jgi:Protein of unknown function (DUF1553)/Protein of unknown function (DUF1549)